MSDIRCQISGKTKAKSKVQWKVVSGKWKGRARTGFRYQVSVVSKNKSKIQKQRLRTKAKRKRRLVSWKCKAGGWISGII